MIIANNLMANFTGRQLKINTNTKNKSMERLGSGYRINRSADDAAGLAISEKMRGQIRGLDRASMNAQDAISLMQTAEGALNEVHAVLHRMNELAVQAANDTNTADDRAIIQEEIDCLVGEIDHISESTEYNTIPVLRAKQLVELSGGKFGNVSLTDKLTITTKGANSTTKTGVNGAYMDFANVNDTNRADMFGKSFTTTCTQNCNQVFTFRFTDDSIANSTVDVVNDNMDITIGVNDITEGKEVVDKIIELVGTKQADFTFSKNNEDLYIGHANGISSDNSKLLLYSINPTLPYAPGMGLLKAADMLQLDEEMHFQIGANEGQAAAYKIRTINSTTLGVDALDVSSHASAGNAITAIQGAIEGVSDYRSYIGAMHNRLEYAIANDDNTSENLQASESRIRDLDFADEMVEFSKSSILEQAAQSMLAQANQMPQGVLQLLQQ